MRRLVATGVHHIDGTKEQREQGPFISMAVYTCVAVYVLRFPACSLISQRLGLLHAKTTIYYGYGGKTNLRKVGRCLRHWELG